MPRVLLFTPKLGYQTRSFDEAAQKLAVDLIFVTDRCHQLDDPWGDRAIPVHFESPESAAAAVLQSVRSQNIDGILVLGDRPAVAAAYAARGLGMLHNHPASVEACRNKLRMREIFREAGLRVPWFRAIHLNPPPEPSLLGITYPCVAKPLSLSASQGVIRANSRNEFTVATARIRRLLESPEIRATLEPNLDQILVEGYIPGREVAVEGLLTDANLRILAIFDKPDPLEGPYFEETIYITPSRLSATQQKEIERCATNAIRAIGLSQGPVHAEFRVNEEGVWPLEVAPRPIGGLCARALRFAPSAANPSPNSNPSRSKSIGLEELLLRHALGLPGADWRRQQNASGVMMIPVPKSGILEKIQGADAAREVPGVTALEITARLHDFIAAWPEGSSYLGFLFATGSTAEEVENSIRTAHSNLHFEFTPRLPVEHPATGRLPAAGN